MSGTRRAIYYGWIVVGVAFAVMFVNYGVRSTQTVIVKNIADDLGIGRGAASLPFTVCIFIYALLAPVTGRLVDRYGPRWVMLGGALIAAAGLWLCSRADNLFTLIIFFGVIFGLGGNGIGLVPSNTSVAMWFRRRLGLALGIATMGIGFGTMILPRLTKLIESQWGWRTSFQFLAYVALALALPVFFLLRGKQAACADEGEEAPEEQCGVALVREGMTLRQALRTSSFWLLFTGFVLIVVAIYGEMLHQVPFATDRAIDEGWAAWSVTVAGATSIIGRYFFGWLADRSREKKYALYPACGVLMLSLVVLIFVNQVWSLMLFAVFFGFGFAAYGPVIPAVVAEVFGKGNMGAIFGVVTTGGALGGAAGPYITGLIFDLTGGYVWAWVLGLACVAVSAVLFSRVRILWVES